jgi:anti-sigma regulatory factor (Ser/Thr protein kinase)
MSAASRGHYLFVYDGDDEYATHTGTFLAEGLDNGEVVAAAVSPEHRSMLEDELDGAGEHVVFIDPHEHYVRPEAALAGYDQELRRMVAAGSAGIRMFGELPFDLQQPGPWDRWMSYEAILTPAFAHHPLRLMCGYDSRTTSEALMRHLLRAHPKVISDTTRASELYADPADVVRALAREPRSVPELPFLEVGDDARELRVLLAAEMTRAGVPDAAAQDGLIAVDELLVNAHRHAGGVRALRAGRVGERFVVELSDDGDGHDDPLAGYLPPRSGHLDGAGLWVARQLSADLELLSSPGGLTARLWI